MKAPIYLVARDGDGWHVAREVHGQVEVARADAPLDDPVLPLLNQLNAWSYAGGPVCLGIASELALSARVETASLPRKGRRTALLYRLEEQLPIEAERLTADFLPTGGSALALAVQTAKVQPLVAELAEAGIHVTAICPTALLALWDCCHAGTPPADYVILADERRADVVRMIDGQPHIWCTVGPNAGEIIQSVQADLLSDPPGKPPVIQVIGNLAPEVAAEIARQAGGELRPSPEEPYLALAARSARRLVEGSPAGWVDFRRDDLSAGGPWQRHGKLLGTAAALAAALLLLITGLCVWRGLAATRLADDYEQQQAAEYRRLFPEGSIPPNVLSRLRSEAARLGGLSDASAGIPPAPQALDQLKQVWASLPLNIQKITNLRIGDGEVLIEGTVPTLSDAQAVAQALAGAGLAMDTPRTESRTGGGVAFTLAGKFHAPAAPAAPAPAAPPEGTAP